MLVADYSYDSVNHKDNSQDLTDYDEYEQILPNKDQLAAVTPPVKEEFWQIKIDFIGRKKP